MNLRDRFYKKVALNPATGCWEWVGAKYSNGYGNLRRVGLAHRISWHIHMGEPGDLCVLHKCDNRKCVNPDHLFLGTRKDNSLDMLRKGRQSKGHKNRCTYIRGEQCPASKLTVDDVLRIRQRVGESSVDVAKEYGVNRTSIRDIWKGNTWKHVT
jgi:HNH endonuclease